MFCQYNNIYLKKYKRKNKKNSTTVVTVPLGTVAIVQNLNKRVGKKKEKKKRTHETTVAATVLHSEIRWVYSIKVR